MRWEIAVVVLLAASVVGIWFKGCLDTDRCLDSGGRYDQDSRRCEYSSDAG